MLSVWRRLMQGCERARFIIMEMQCRKGGAIDEVNDYRAVCRSSNSL
jgi:hypothetical protein